MQPDILIFSRSFLPQAGGIEEYVYNRCLQNPERIIVMTSACDGDQAFDAALPFPVYRWSIPSYLLSLQSVSSSRLLVVVTQVVRTFVIIWLAIRLFFRYRYRYIEWCHGYGSATLSILSYLLPIRFFVYLHGNDLFGIIANSKWRSRFNQVIERAEGIVCNSSFTEKILKSHFNFDTPTHIINPTVRPGKFGTDKILDQAQVLRAQVRQAHHIPESAVVILSVGRLIRRKGFDRVIENLPQLLAEGLNVYYLVCGTGDMEAELKQQVSQLKLEERVIFIGYVPDDQLGRYYAACDLFAMLTFFDAGGHSIEGFGIVYLEAAYFGKPAIASRIGGVEDAVYHEKTGLLVDPDNPQETFAMLHLLCKNQQLREQLGVRAKELAIRKTSHESLYSFEGKR